MVCYGTERKSKLKKIFLENKIITGLGKISYGLYVYHFPILALSKLYVVEKITSMGASPDFAYITVSISAGLLAVGISWLSYHFMEKRILALKNQIPLRISE
jgi:peptidoglycan/LPS O-acetylase OafA/YrhL